MKIAIVGGGRSGRAIQHALADHGLTGQLFSRSTGFDILKADAADRLGDVDVIIEATGRFTTSRKVATDFFTHSTRAVGAAARAAGARHILLSIVDCEKDVLQGYGYFSGKAAQERVARAENPGVTVIRSTQWFEFAEQNLDRFTFGPFALVPRMKIKPVALDAVAAVIAETVVGDRTGTCDISGPEVMTLWEMTQKVRRNGIVQVPLPTPGTTWRAFRDGGLVPGPDVEQVGPRFGEWLAAQTE